MWSALSLDSTFKKVANQLKRAGGGARFFNAQGKRGESVELHQDLNSNDRDRQKNALKRIIALMVYRNQKNLETQLPRIIKY